MSWGQGQKLENTNREWSGDRGELTGSCYINLSVSGHFNIDTHLKI
jgi:hypothetical protein